MTMTDREIIKEHEAGVLQSYGLAGTPKAAVIAKHTRTVILPKVGAENAETAVAETGTYVVNRACRLKTAKIVNNTNIDENATDSVYLTVGKSTSGAASTTIATWNTGVSTEGGAIVKWVAASMTVSPNADADLAVGDVITYTKAVVLTGGLVDGCIVLDLEEI